MEGCSKHPLLRCLCYSLLPLVSKFHLCFKAYNWLFSKHFGSPWPVRLVWTSHLAALFVSLLLDFPPLMAVRDMCPSLGRAGHKGKERTWHILISTSVLSKAKCLTRRSRNVCETEEKCTVLLPRSIESQRAFPLLQCTLHNSQRHSVH